MDELAFWLKIIGGTTTAVVTFIGLLKYFDYRSKNQKVESIGKSFMEIIEKLTSLDEIERTSGAILLRRFFDKDTEMGLGLASYSSEAVDIIAASLRSTPTSNFQKVLADGLGYAPNLQKLDLQNTNLQNAYLASEENDFSETDFYRADLSKASFTGAIMKKTVFYQARLINTIFRDANLEESNFYEANLLGSNFSNAKLDGANFTNAINIPSDILPYLNDDGIYYLDNIKKKFKNFKPNKSLKVFISKPNSLTLDQQIRYDNLVKLLSKKVLIETLERESYQPFGALGNISSQIASCAGVVLIGFEQYKIANGKFRVDTKEQKNLDGIPLSTPWNQIEAGMAAMKGLPILVLADEGVKEGIFESTLDDQLLFYTSFSKSLDSKVLSNTINDWYNEIKK